MKIFKPDSRASGGSAAGQRTAARGGLRLACLILLGAWAAPDVSAQVEFRQEEIRYNLRKTNGLPISTVTNVPAGSDGRGPTLAQQQSAGLTEVPATTNQFRGFVE
jgi:hypothetical protein